MYHEYYQPHDDGGQWEAEQELLKSDPEYQKWLDKLEKQREQEAIKWLNEDLKNGTHC